MTPTDQQPGVPIAHSHSLETKAWFTCGFGWLVVTPIVISAAKGGEWFPAIFFLVVLLGSAGLAIWTTRTTSPRFATLYPDRLVIHDSKKSETVVFWSDVESIRWPRHANSDSHMLLKVRDSDSVDSRTGHVKLKDADADDRATLIGYMHLAADDAEQENWPEFCVGQAVRLLDRLESDADDADVGESDADTSNSSVTSLAKRSSSFWDKHAFLSGLLMPLFIPLAFLLVSRKTYWWTAVLILVSAFVNIRLVWGQWLSPFTEYCLCFAAALFVLGFIEGLIRGKKKYPPVDELPYVRYSLVFLIVGWPLLGNAAARGWVPRVLFSEVVVPILFVLLLIPVHIQSRRRKRQIEKDAEPGSEKLQRWAAFEAGLLQS